MRLIDAEGSELQTQLKIIREAEYQIYGSGSWGFTAKCERAIEDAPTIQPEIVRCKDCKHWKDSDGVFRRGTGAESKCPLSLHQVYEGTFYCGLGERKEVTT